MQQGFKIKPLGEFLNFLNGKSIKPGGIGIYPAYGSNGIIGGSDGYLFENGIIIGRVGAYCGSIAYCPTKFWASDNTIVAIPKDTAGDVRYFAYLLKHLELNNYAGGAAQPLVTQTVLKRVEAPITKPTLQKKIAAILSAYDDLIENNTRRIQVLKEIARRIYEEWFVQFRFPGHENVMVVQSECGLIPNGWEVMNLGAVCERIQSGGTPSRTNDGYWVNGTIDWYKTKELWDDYLFDSEEKITEQAVNDRKTRLFESGTILMAIYGSPTVGRLGILTKPATCNQAALGLIPMPEEITLWMLYYTLRSLRAELNRKAQGAAQQNISKEKVVETLFVKPTWWVQNRFQELVSPLWEQLLKLQQKNSNLRRTRDLLLPKLISGEIDVSHFADPEGTTA